MQLRKQWKREFYVKKWSVIKDEFGGITDSYSETAVTHEGNIQPVTDAAVIEAYGARESRLYNIFADTAEGISKKDGVCFGIGPEENPNFEVVDILPWMNHTKLLIRGLL